ncbi:MAG: sulfatase-like hydrolase/transferase, partial [Verrucomicrobiae bacterium]|nr:sulfatase-like hydrolase/transferase [Verrucomicrobiae bacterium]
LKADDLDDLPGEARLWLHKPNYRWFSTLMHYTREDPDYYRSAIRGYMAASSYCDAHVGKVLDALEASGRAENTIVILWSDHGYFLGQKERWEKFSLYDVATHVPLIVRVPGQKNKVLCDKPVNLIDIFPTLADLCGLPIPENLDGTSLVPLLENPRLAWKPTLITYEYKNHSIRSEDYRYTRYKNGDEELYHTRSDPQEWFNISNQPGSRRIMDQLAEWLPKSNAKPIGN